MACLFRFRAAALAALAAAALTSLAGASAPSTLADMDGAADACDASLVVALLQTDVLVQREASPDGAVIPAPAPPSASQSAKPKLAEDGDTKVNAEVQLAAASPSNVALAKLLPTALALFPAGRTLSSAAAQADIGPPKQAALLATGEKSIHRPTTEGPLDLDNTGLAFLLATAAGLSTSLGAAAVFNERLVQIASKSVLAAGLGFSAGVMLYVSFVEILVKANGAFHDHGLSDNMSYVAATVCLFAGMALMRFLIFLAHMLDPNYEEVCSDHLVKDSKRLERMGLNTALAIALHNFPEGLATFMATLVDPSVGLTLAVAIGIHNLPEGLCVALPIFYATDSRAKAFFWGTLSGVTEPLGAVIGWAVLKSTGHGASQLSFAVLFGLVAGMMIMIVLSDILPTAYRYDPEDTCVTTSTCVGMLVMAASLCLFLF